MLMRNDVDSKNSVKSINKTKVYAILTGCVAVLVNGVFGGGGNIYGVLCGIVVRAVFLTLYHCFVMTNRTFVFGFVGRHAVTGDMLDFLIGVGGNFTVYHRFYLAANGADIFRVPMVSAIDVVLALFKVVTVLAGVSARRKNKKRAPHTTQQ